MALTTTATRHTLACVFWCLSLHKPVIVAASPYRDNISYEITNNANMDKFTSSICEELKATGAKFPKTVVFVRSYKDCSYIYTMIMRKSGIYFTDPPGLPNVSKFRLVDMYSRILTVEKKIKLWNRFAQLVVKYH